MTTTETADENRPFLWSIGGDMKAGNIGYLLWGSVGTGKSYLAVHCKRPPRSREISVK